MTTNNTHIHRDSIAKVSEAIDNALVAAVHIMDAEDGINLDVVLVSLAEARAYAVQANIMATVADRVIDVASDQPRVYADELSPDYGKSLAAAIDKSKKPLELPKLRKQPSDGKVHYKPGIGKLLRKPIEFDCPACGAEAGTFCFKYEGPGAHPKRTEERNNGHFFHTRRTDISTAANKKIRKANVMP